MSTSLSSLPEVRGFFNVRSTRGLTLLVCLLPGTGWAAETAVQVGMSAGYSYDDNVRVSPSNQISLAGLQVDGFVELQHGTPRLKTNTRLALGADRYDDADFDSNDPLLQAPDTSDFDSESYEFSTDLSYEWERHTLSLYGRLSRDSTINTQFVDGGLGGLRQIGGATDIDTSIITPTWRWQLNERQSLETNLLAQFADYESDFYVNYDYYSLRSTWFYLLNERMQLQVRPLASRYENAAAFSITSDTYGLEAGVIWSINEKWQLNVLGGATQVTTDNGRDGFFIFNPETGQVEFIELEESDNNGFTGSGEVTFTEERYGFSASIDSGYSPSSNGYLQTSNEALFKYYWKVRERLRFDCEGRLGKTDTSGDQVDNERTYGEVAIRVGYQFAEEWWLSARYRYREQDYERNQLGSADGNSVSASVSYRLPKEIL